MTDEGMWFAWIWIGAIVVGLIYLAVVWWWDLDRDKPDLFS